MAGQPTTPPVEGLDACPEILVDGYQGLLVAHGVIKLNLFTEFADPNTGGVRRKAVARLAIAAPNLAAVLQSLGEVLPNVMAEIGAAPAPTNGPTRQ